MFIAHRFRNALIVIDGNGFAPVALSSKGGIAQFVLHFSLSKSLGFENVEHLFLSLFHTQPIDERTVDKGSFLALKSFFLDISTCHHFHYGKTELLGKCMVPCIVSGDGHHRARTVAGQHIIGHPDGNGLLGERVKRIGSSEDPTHSFGLAHSLPFRTPSRLFPVGIDWLFTLLGRPLGDAFMFGCKDQESSPVEGVGSGGKYVDRIVGLLHGKAQASALRASDPVPLRFFEGFAPCDRIQPVQQAFCIGGDAQAPLRHFLAFHRMTPSL